MHSARVTQKGLIKLLLTDQSHQTDDEHQSAAHLERFLHLIHSTQLTKEHLASNSSLGRVLNLDRKLHSEELVHDSLSQRANCF